MDNERGLRPPSPAIGSPRSLPSVKSQVNALFEVGSTEEHGWYLAKSPVCEHQALEQIDLSTVKWIPAKGNGLPLSTPPPPPSASAEVQHPS